jgi:hypothetical protein
MSDRARPPAQPDEPSSQSTRIAGGNRFAAAAELARRAAGDDPQRVWLATGTAFPDALAASASGEPVLLVTGDAVPAATAGGPLLLAVTDEMTRPTCQALLDLEPSTTYVVGGRNALRPAVARQAAVAHAAASRLTC